MTRHKKARIVAERVAARIREVAPEGLGHWHPAGDLVVPKADAFLDRLAEWETTDSPGTRARVETAGAALVEAWAGAARQWEEAGRPALGETDEVEVGRPHRVHSHRSRPTSGPHSAKAALQGGGGGGE